MALYECVFIARQDIGSSQAQALIEEFVKIIEDNGGSVPKQEYWGLKTLSYRIKKNRKGHYVLLNIDGPHAAIAELERQLGLHEDILRTLIVRVEEHEEGPSAMMQSRGRDDRGGRRGDRGDRGSRDRGPREGGGREGGSRDRGPRDDDKPAETVAKSDDAPTEAKAETKNEGEAA